MKEGDYIGKQRYDYTQAELEYITSKCSYAILSEKYEIPLTSLTKYARDNEWVLKRKKHCENIVVKTADKIVTKKSDKMAALITSADKTAKVIENALADEEQLYRYVVTESKGNSTQKTSEYTFKKMDTRALRDIVSSLKDLTAVIRNLNEIPTNAEKEARKIAKEKLQLEKKKAESSDQRLDTNITVEFIDEDNNT